MLLVFECVQRTLPAVGVPVAASDAWLFLLLPGSSFSSDSFADSLPPQCRYGFDSRPVYCVATMPGEVPGNLDALAPSCL